MSLYSKRESLIRLVITSEMSRLTICLVSRKRKLMARKYRVPITSICQTAVTRWSITRTTVMVMSLTLNTKTSSTPVLRPTPSISVKSNTITTLLPTPVEPFTTLLHLPIVLLQPTPRTKAERRTIRTLLPTRKMTKMHQGPKSTKEKRWL